MANTPNAAPAPDSGGNSQPQPNLSIVPEKRKRRSPSELNQGELKEVNFADSLRVVCLKPEVAPIMLKNKIPAAFLTALDDKIKQAISRSNAAKTCSSAKKGATAAERSAQETLLNSLSTLQSAARTAFAESDPARLDNYLVGEDIGESLERTKADSESIINAANADRPGSVDTEFIVRVTGEREIFINQQGKQKTELGKGKQERQLRKDLVEAIKADRKTVQRAADTAWPHYKSTSAEMRSLFKLPKDRPYSY